MKKTLFISVCCCSLFAAILFCAAMHQRISTPTYNCHTDILGCALEGRGPEWYAGHFINEETGKTVWYIKENCGITEYNLPFQFNKNTCTQYKQLFSNYTIHWLPYSYNDLHGWAEEIHAYSRIPSDVQEYQFHITGTIGFTEETGPQILLYVTGSHAEHVKSILNETYGDAVLFCDEPVSDWPEIIVIKP